MLLNCMRKLLLHRHGRDLRLKHRLDHLLMRSKRFLLVLDNWLLWLMLYRRLACHWHGGLVVLWRRLLFLLWLEILIHVLIMSASLRLMILHRLSLWRCRHCRRWTSVMHGIKLRLSLVVLLLLVRVAHHGSCRDLNLHLSRGRRRWHRTDGSGRKMRRSCCD